MSYAENTSVPVDRSKAEIERLLQKYGCAGTAFLNEPHRAIVGFRMNGKIIRFHLPLPSPEDRKFRATPSGRDRAENAAAAEFHQELRRLWRAMFLSIKGKLSNIESGIATFEEEFMAYIVLPNKQTAGEFLLPQIDQAYASGHVPAAMLGWEG